MNTQHCQKPGCQREATTTLTYDYGDSLAVMGPLAPTSQAEGVNLCEWHADRLVLPKGWQLIRHVSVA